MNLTEAECVSAAMHVMRSAVLNDAARDAQHVHSKLARSDQAPVEQASHLYETAQQLLCSRSQRTSIIAVAKASCETLCTGDASYDAKIGFACVRSV